MVRPAKRLIVFVRAPRLGAVKTRLAAGIGDKAALKAYRQLVQTVLGKLKGLGEVELRFSPDDASTEVRAWLRPGWTANPQGPGDLGARMDRAFAQHTGRGACRAVLIGSDCPALAVRDLEEAWEALAENDLVIGPATDGGYWLIGLNQPQPELFQRMSWSTSQVLRETLARARQLDLRVKLLRLLADIDTEQDWAEFRRAGRGGG